MRAIRIALSDQVIEVICPPSVAEDVTFIFRNSLSEASVPARRILIEESAAGTFSIIDEGEEPVIGVRRGDLATFVMDAVVRDLVTDLNSAVAIHAGAVAWRDKVVLIAGESGAGKSSLTAWFTAQGFHYLTDEVVLLTREQTLLGFPRAMVLKPGSAERVVEFANFQGAMSVPGGTHTLVHPHGAAAGTGALPCGLVVFPQFVAGSDLQIQSTTAAETLMRLVGCNLNARNLPDGGFRALSAFARATPALILRYGAFEQLDGAFDVLVRFVLENGLDGLAQRRFLSVFPKGGSTGAGVDAQGRAMADQKHPILAPTPRRAPRKLTIGMATYDDYDGVYFSLQSLRLYHPEVADEVDFLVVDNHPDGVCAAPLKDLEKHIPNYRYVPVQFRSGTAVRDAIFEEAGGDFVLCLDCHVLIVPGALARLLRYFTAHPGTKDLLQGPLVHDELTSFATHFQPQWKKGMYGHWGMDERGRDSDAPPFDIPMQGLGLFACARASWPGFNPHFRGFGGEEGYIHEKFRLRGGRTLCLPFLRWLHRFQRPLGVPYESRWEDRVRNYVLGFRELGLPTAEIEAHFRELLGDVHANATLEAAQREADTLYGA